MRGNADGSAVWFDPIGVLIGPGQTVRWINTDRGNSHTSTAYHPQNTDHPRRIPAAAEPWNSDYLLPDQTFELRFTAAGVYDYFCIPHEEAGMVGRLVVGLSDERRRALGGSARGRPSGAPGGRGDRPAPDHPPRPLRHDGIAIGPSGLFGGGRCLRGDRALPAYSGFGAEIKA